MAIIKELIETIRTLGALEKRTEDVLKSVQTLYHKVDALADRVTRIESDQRYLRESVRNEILADIKGELVRAKLLLDNIDHLEKNQKIVRR
jgi:hypothetical protein